jgi:uncharacterized protein YggU (UPF0235/DUF167 family)
VDGPSTRLRLRVSPRAADAHIVGRHGDGWKVRVASAPERGQANQAVLALLAEALHVPHTQLELVGGGSARDKLVAVQGLSAIEVERRLEAAAVGA